MMLKRLALFQTKSKTPFLGQKRITSSAIFVVTLLLSWGMLYYQTLQSYQAGVLSRLSLSLHVLDEQFKQADETVKALSQQVSGDCHQDQTTLMKTLVDVPSIQTLGIVKNGVVVCSTFPSIIGKPIPKGRFLDFNVLTSSLIVPGQLMFLLKSGEDDFFVAASLHGATLFSIVNVLDKNSNFHLNYQGGWVDDKNQLVTSPNPDNHYLHSDYFPYSISTRFDKSKWLYYFVINNIGLLAFLFLLALLPARCYLKFGERFEKTRAIKQGIKKGQFVPFSQGIVDNQGRLVGCEILVRWFYRSQLVRPDDFIPVAENSMLIVPMSNQLIRDTHTILHSQLDGCPEDFYLSFNISPIQLSERHVQGLIDALNCFRQCDKLSSIKIILELTERQIVQYNAETQASIDLLAELGVAIYIDDFGTGYSSFENILQLNIDGLKIDKHFVDRYPEDVISTNLIDNMMDLAARLDVAVVAEGVETQSQADALIDKGVDYLQGYHYCRPVNLLDLTSKINLLTSRQKQGAALKF